MYCPPAFREDRPEVLYEAIRLYPLATLITYGASGIVANVVPFSLRMNENGGRLRAHLAKANEQIADLQFGAQVLVVFQGPQAYVTPSWYATKREHGKVVPTWNYVVVQVRGTPCIIDDAAWVKDQLTELTDAHERDRLQPWSINDAPSDFIAGQMKGVIGLEVPIERIEGKWKVSQNQPANNRQGVERGLRAAGFANLAGEVADRGNSS